jgi:hypothetical protein
MDGRSFIRDSIRKEIRQALRKIATLPREDPERLQLIHHAKYVFQLIDVRGDPEVGEYRPEWRLAEKLDKVEEQVWADFVKHVRVVGLRQELREFRRKD